MTAQERKQKIEDVIMATDSILQTDWLTRLDAYIEASKKEEQKKLHWFYCGAFVLLALIFIGYVTIYQPLTITK